MQQEKEILKTHLVDNKAKSARDSTSSSLLMGINLPNPTKSIYPIDGGNS